MPHFAPRIPIRRIQHIVIAAACLGTAPLSVFAAPASNVAAGQKLAQQFCAECHVVVPSTKSGWTDAPAFEAIANRPGTAAATLSAFIQKPHMHMLNTERPPKEANQLAAYIMSLRKP